MLTRIGIAFVDILFAPFTSVAGRTMADELVDAILTATAIHAGTRRTLVHVAQASRVVVAAWTLAFETIHQVHADAVICARIRCTLVDVNLAVDASESGYAFA